MPESDEHSNLVALLHDYVTESFCEGKRDRILSDSAGGEPGPRPPSIEGFVPDVYVMLSDQGRVVIGEAKSMGDLENSHTEAQVTAFLEGCGMAEGSTFILAVPWPVERLATALLAKFWVREGLPQVETVVLSEASWIGAAAGPGRSIRCRS